MAFSEIGNNDIPKSISPILSPQLTVLQNNPPPLGGSSGPPASYLGIASPPHSFPSAAQSIHEERFEGTRLKKFVHRAPSFYQ